MPTNRTIAISKEVKEKLIELKTHPRETFNDLLKRLLKMEKLYKQRKEKKFDV